MIGIVLTGHGKFAEGITSAVELIAGTHDQFRSIVFTEGMSSEELSRDIADAIDTVNTGEGVLVFTDLKGGSPFQMAAMAAHTRENVEVLTGTNISMLLEAVLMRSAADNVRVFARKLVETGKSQVDVFELSHNEESDDDSDGI